MADAYADLAPSLTAPATNAAIVSPSDNSALPQVSRAVYVGQGGDVAVEMLSGDTVNFRAVPGGSTLPIRARAIRSSGTTATNIVALW